MVGWLGKFFTKKSLKRPKFVEVVNVNSQHKFTLLRNYLEFSKPPNAPGHLVFGVYVQFLVSLRWKLMFQLISGQIKNLTTFSLKRIWGLSHVRLSLVKLGYFIKANRCELCTELVTNRDYGKPLPYPKSIKLLGLLILCENELWLQCWAIKLATTGARGTRTGGNYQSLVVNQFFQLLCNSS